MYYGTLITIPLPFKSSVENVKATPLIGDMVFIVFLILGTCGIILMNYAIESVPGTFTELWRNGVIQSKNSSKNPIRSYNKQLRELENTINSKKSYIVATAYIVIHNFLALYRYYLVPVTESPIIPYHDIRAFPLSGIVVHIMYGLVYFVLVIMIYKGYFLVQALRKLNKNFNIQIKPLHQDKCGGLKPVGDLCIKIDYMLLVFFAAIVIFSVFSFTEEIEILVYFGILLYTASATFFFFYPLWPVHNSMKRQKNTLIRRLNEKFDPFYQEIYKEITIKGANISSEKLEKIEQIEKIHESATRMPIWPFDVVGLIRFFTTVFVPVLGIIIDTIVRGG